MSNYIYLVRHGETEYNNREIIHGQYDVPLNEYGIKQAKLLGLELKNTHFDLCICSPLGRAKQTANEILKHHPNVPIIYDDRLMEIYLGDLENTTEYPIDYLQDEKLDVLIKHGVESHAHFFMRIKSALDDITTKYNDKDILVVSHCGAIRMSTIYFNPTDECIEKYYYKINIRNCSVHRVENKKQDKLPILITYDVDKNKYPWIVG